MVRTNSSRVRSAVVCASLVWILACGKSVTGEFYSFDDGEGKRLVSSSNGIFEIYENDNLEGIGTYERKNDVIYLTIADDTVRALYARDKIAVEPEGKKQDLFVAKEVWIAEHGPPEDG